MNSQKMLELLEEKIIWPIYIGFLIYVVTSEQRFSIWWYISLAFSVAVPVIKLLPLIIIRFRWKKRLGVVRVYQRRKDAEQHILDAYTDTKFAKIFVIRGKTDFVSGRSTFYYPSTDKEKFKQSIDNKQKSVGEIRVLLASENSAMFSKERYESIKSKTKIEKNSIYSKSAIGLVETDLKKIGQTINLAYRKHSQAFMAKFYLFDNCGFVIFNERYTQIDTLSPVLQIKCVSDKVSGKKVGLYGTLENYFDDIWDFYSESPKE